MTNMEKANEMLTKNPELMEKYNAEVERLVDTKEATTPEEAMIKAIKTVLDIEVSEDEFKAPTNETQKLNLDELDNVAGGSEGYGEYGESLGEYVFRKAVVGFYKGISRPFCLFGQHQWDYGDDDDNPNPIRVCLVCGKKETW